MGGADPAMNGLRRAVTAFLAVKLIVLVFNTWRFPVLARSRTASVAARRPDRQPSVSLLIPMRNEAARLAETVPAMLTQHIHEIIILDDESTDDTRPRAGALLAGHPRARVQAGTPAPSGWVGKNWACHQLAAAASGSLLVFCDADVLLTAGAVDAVVAEMHAQQADVFSVFPRQITQTLGERLITPLIDDVLLCFLPFSLLSARVPQAAAANGSMLAFTRPAYDRLGGFAAVRSEIVEDLAIARRARKAGLKLGLALGGPLVATRMYTGYREVVDGLSRGLVPATGGSGTRLAAAAGWHLIAYTLPWGMAARRAGWILPLAMGVTERVLVEIKTGRRAVWQAALTPLSPLAAGPIVARALRGNHQWRGRVYP